MEALRRSTLKWEKITIKGKALGDVLKYDDGKNINVMTTLAVRGKLTARKSLGYCSRCGKIMTRKEFEAHNISHANPKTCVKCYNMRVNDPTASTGKDGAFIHKSKMYCGYGYDSKELHSGFNCPAKSCNGEFMTDLSEKLSRAKVNIPDKILTMKSLATNDAWTFGGKSDSQGLCFKHNRHNISAWFDLNGYLKYFIYKETKCNYDRENELLRGTNGYTIVSTNIVIISMIRRLYDER